MPADPTTDLAAEQSHLTDSRTQLQRMRARTAAMDASAGGDWVSREFLKSTFVLRMRQLADDPTVPLFFGRLDYADDEGGDFGPFHIGRRHISDIEGEPMVIDWRAPVSLPFYRATRSDPMGVRRRRRFGFQHGALTSFEDEDLVGAARPGVLGDPRAGDRAAARRPDARHRGHHPARAGRDRAIRPLAVDLRPGSTGNREDGRRPAPGGVPPLRAPRAADPPGRHGRRTQRQLPALHPRRAARARRGRGDAVDDRRAGGEAAARAEPQVVDPKRGARRGGDAQGRRPVGRGAQPGVVVARHHADRGARRAPRCPALAGGDLRGRGAGRFAARAGRAVRRGPRDGAAGARPPDPGADGAGRRLPRRPGAERRGAQQAGQGLHRARCGRRWSRPGWCGDCSAMRRSWPPRPTAC